MDYLNNMWAKIRAVLVSMPPSQRYTLVALLAVLVVSLGMLLAGAPREEYTTVLTDLKGGEIGMIQSALSGSSVRYKFAEGMLLVKPEDKDRVWMVLSEKGGLPSDVSKSFGFDDLVKPKSFSLETNAVQRMKANIALQNELSKAIETAPEIRNAQVHIAACRDGLIGPETATAAIALVPHSPEPISERKLAAICRLVARAVGPNLSPEDVQVSVPATGQSFSLGEENSTFAKASSRLDLTKSWDNYFKKAVRDFLRPTFGTVETLITTSLDTTTKTSRKTEYEVTEKTTKSETTTAAGAPGGEALTQPNVATSVVTASSSASTGPASETMEKEEKFSPSLVESTDVPPGEVTDIQIAVLVDQARLEAVIRSADHLDAEAQIDQAKIAQACETWRQTLVAALPVTGDDAKKVSKVTFAAAPFATLQVASLAGPADASAGRILGVIGSNWQRIAMACFALVALFMIRSVARHSPGEEADFTKLQEEAKEEIELPEIEVDIEQKRAAKMRESIEEVIQSDPQSAVGLVRRWMAKES